MNITLTLGLWMFPAFLPAIIILLIAWLDRQPSLVSLALGISMLSLLTRYL
jgi:hypothetical protein